MNYIIYSLALISIYLASNNFDAYKKTNNTIILVSLIISVGFSIVAIIFLEWLALGAGFIMTFALKRYIKRYI